LYDVAREAGVSTATVSRVVHNRDAVRPATRQRVLDVIEALGYIPTVPRRVWRGSGKK
jgi:LacI family transcriptional regulator